MTEQLRAELEDRLEKAEATGDQNLINTARRAIDHATLECQAHTADRIKRIEQDVITIKTTTELICKNQEHIAEKHKTVASAVYATKDELNALKNRNAGEKAGMAKLMEFLKWVVAIGGGGALVKFIQHVNI